MWVIVAFVAGLVVGCISVTIVLRRKSIGYLRVDHSDPLDSPYLFLELSEDMRAIYSKKYVMLKVRIEDFIPRK